jgi:hypothetical protein
METFDDPVPPLPGFVAPMGPSDSLVPVSLGSGSPCLGLPRGGRLVLCGAALRLGHDAGATRQRAPCAGMGHRLPVAPESLVERRGSPRLLDRPLRACRGRTPRRVRRSLAHCRSRRHGLPATTGLGHTGIRFRFRSCIPTAHTFARLRFNGHVTVTAARLATDPDGLSPGRTGFAPAGRLFRISRGHLSFLSDQQGLVATWRRKTCPAALRRSCLGFLTTSPRAPNLARASSSSFHPRSGRCQGQRTFSARPFQ